MKIITAVWLSVPADLRDDWLIGGGGGMGGSAGMGDVDGAVEDALPLEQGVRELVHWWNLKHFPEAMGADPGLLEAEADFFARELERMGVEKGEEEGLMEEMVLG
ncbi:Factor arrest protein 11, partial [Teratosphaeriaceae sp. CCFEE 6253]